MRQSEAQYAKRASAAPACLQLFSASQAVEKRRSLALAGVGSVTRYVTAM